MGRAIHQEVVKECGFKFRDTWFEQQPESALENEDY